MTMNLHTGHFAIDQQHDALAKMVEGLDTVCEKRRQTGEYCRQCSYEHQRVCSDRLSHLISDLLGFMLDHFVYEEKLMRLLPDTEECRKHIDSHHYAHAEISRLLSNLTAELDRENPSQSAIHLRHILMAWLGNHATTHDSSLAITLDGAYDVEIDFDRELTNLLRG
jgi:hemerythrin-like metal-binding protein